MRRPRYTWQWFTTDGIVNLLPFPDKYWYTLHWHWCRSWDNDCGLVCLGSWAGGQLQKCGRRGCECLFWHVRPLQCFTYPKFMRHHAGLSNILKEERGGDSKTISNNLAPDEPIFQFNTQASCYRNIKNSSVPTFRTVAEVIGDFAAKRSKLKGPSLQWYPWDK